MNARPGNRIVERDGRRFVIDPREGELEILYGLPGNVEFCGSCVISNQRAAPSVVVSDKRDSRKETIHFGQDGVCEGLPGCGAKGYHRLGKA